MKKLIELIHGAQKFILSTHRQCDGDGLGAELALFYALKKLKKDVHVINIDKTPRKYRFLNPHAHILYLEEGGFEIPEAKLALVFDTNDSRLVEPLFSRLSEQGTQIVFVDHHPALTHGPKPTTDSWIDEKCASTGEMTYRLIRGLGVELDRDIARCLYTSIAFDTQFYRYIRNSPVSHEITAELLKHNIDPEDINRHLFSHQTAGKVAFLAKALGQIEFFDEGKTAFLKLCDEDLTYHQLEPDESRDVIDMLMNIESLEAAVLFREDAPNHYKMSLRSKGKLEILSIAEKLGGGGHTYAAGAFVRGELAPFKQSILSAISKKMKDLK
ncbi:MAG: bifunctional oligoribonuclease/PAP phosphatase NrnA [Pseudobdellovibrionaceae bacterium]